MAFEAARLKTQSGARAGESSAAAGLHRCGSGRAGDAANRAGSDRGCSSDDCGTQPESAIARTIGRRRGMRRQVISD
jgi:hypothetical protein